MRLLGCTAMQGFYFSKPLPADQLDALLADEQANNTASVPLRAEAQA